MLGLFVLLKLCLLVYCVGAERNGNIQCLTSEGKPIDWFIIYKLPNSVFKRQAFFYMDADNKRWKSSSSTMDKNDNAVYKTLQQVYESGGEMMYAMYNDQPSTRQSSASQTADLHYRQTYGHTKGVISFSKDVGFWLIHSAPKFPNPKHARYEWPDNLKRNGQTFLCISLRTESALDDIGKQLLYNYPDMYDHAMPASFKSKYPKMAAALGNQHVTEPPWQRETILKSLAGRKFHSFAKYSSFNADLYGDWLAPRFQQSLLVETWQDGRGKLCSNCTGKYWVYNVERVSFKAKKNAEFKETVDHSKWAITMSAQSPWICIGDINRAKTQMTRSGGTVCFQDQQVWEQFHDLICTRETEPLMSSEPWPPSYSDHVYEFVQTADLKKPHCTVHDCKPYSRCIPA